MLPVEMYIRSRKLKEALGGCESSYVPRDRLSAAYYSRMGNGDTPSTASQEVVVRFETFRDPHTQELLYKII